MSTSRSRLFALLAVVALAAGACSSDDGGSEAGDGATTTAPADATAADPAYAGPGPHEVGVTTVALEDGRRTVIWYPAADDATDAPFETFDIASLLSPELQGQIPAELRPQYEIGAHPGAEAATDDGPFPVVLFSHGFSGFPEQSADLVTHLASWGFVVVAPTHVERSLDGLLGTAARGVPEAESDEVLSGALDAALAAADDAASPLHDLVDGESVAVTGHSAGAGAAYLTASSDDRIDAFIAYSLGVPRPDEDGEVTERPVPEVPGMVMAGAADETIAADASRQAFDGMAPPKYYVEIAGAGHLVFSDLCLIGRDQGGLTGLIDAAGLDLPENLVRLASDGCEPDDLDPALAFGAIDHLSTAFLRYELGIDPEPVGLDEATAASFDEIDVTFEAVPS
ncbi:MAG: dienelactone hydrolase family protein [Acidimicrobiales bacterium]|nr:dienelactone hydrolase family protein [Acidimicrobiales bacterium]